MLFTMLFEDSEIEEKKETAPKDATVVRKCPTYLLAVYPLAAICLIALGVLLLVLHPFRQYFATAVCLLAIGIAPLFFFIDALTFRLSVGNGRILLRKLGTGETSYAYTDVTWMMQTPDRKKSAVLLFVKGKQIARILPGAPNYRTAVSLRHKGTLSTGEKELLRKLNSAK